MSDVFDQTSTAETMREIFVLIMNWNKDSKGATKEDFWKTQQAIAEIRHHAQSAYDLATQEHVTGDVVRLKNGNKATIALNKGNGLYDLDLPNGRSKTDVPRDDIREKLHGEFIPVWAFTLFAYFEILRLRGYEDFLKLSSSEIIRGARKLYKAENTAGRDKGSHRFRIKINE